VCISQAVGPIRADLGLSKTRMSFVLMAFTLAYGLFEVPTGHWGDRIGSRAILTRIVVWWSAFTALTGAATGFVSLLVVRFLFGAGEAGAMPNAARVINRWFPLAERGRVQGLVQTAALVGGTVAPVVAAYLIKGVTWRWAFVLFGLVGVVWAACFWLWFRDSPADHPAVNDAERALIGPAGPGGLTHDEPIPWKAALRCPSIWVLGVIIMCGSFNSYLYISWFPNYLQEARGVGQIGAGWLASLVLAGGALGTLLGGLLADFVVRRFPNRARARRWQGGICYSLAALALTLGLLCESPLATSAFAALSCLAAMSMLSTWWFCAADISGRHLGALFGLMNGMGVCGALSSQYLFGALADLRGAQGYRGREQWDPAFYVVVAVLFLGALCWACYPARPVEERAHQDGKAGP
jgi:sugar phosphate permease